MQIKSIRRVTYDHPIKIFDLSIEDFHNFPIGESSVISHNCSLYHHGEASLEATIVGLAQNYTGANNLNYLEPMGQFGSRLSPDSAAARYIFTKLTPAFRKIFKREDDLILEHLVEDGDEIEPKFYMPILPNVLINGVSGMGTGFATKILPYNPLDLKKYIMNVLKGKTTNIKLVPWFRGFTGEVERLPSGQVVIKGKVEKVNTSTLLITEIPVGIYQDDYKAAMFKMMDSGYIKDFVSRSTTNKLEFELTVPRLTAYEDIDIITQKLKLISRESENLTVWLPNGKLKCFANPESLVDTFIEERLKLYEIRRVKTIDALKIDYELLEEKAKFIQFYIERSLEISKLTKSAFETLLIDNGFKSIEKLLDIKVYNMTKDQIDKLLAEVVKVKLEIEYYEKSTATSLYIKDLDELDLKKDLEV